MFWQSWSCCQNRRRILTDGYSYGSSKVPISPTVLSGRFLDALGSCLRVSFCTLLLYTVTVYCKYREKPVRVHNFVPCFWESTLGTSRWPIGWRIRRQSSQMVSYSCSYLYMIDLSINQSIKSMMPRIIDLYLEAKILFYLFKRNEGSKKVFR